MQVSVESEPIDIGEPEPPVLGDPRYVEPEPPVEPEPEEEV